MYYAKYSRRRLTVMKGCILMKYFEHNGIYANYDSFGRFILSTEPQNNLPKQKWENINANAVINNNTILRVIDGQSTGEYDSLIIEKTVFGKKGAETVYYNKHSEVRLYITAELCEELSVAVQSTVIENAGREPLIINSLSSAKAVYVGLGEQPWWDENWVVHYCRNVWQGEGQWRASTLSELGMYASNGHMWAKNSFSISSRSSWSCAEYYPLLVIENRKSKKCWFFEIESGGDWKIECSAYGGTGSEGFNVTMTAADEALGWNYVLQPGEKYESVPAFYGVVNGGFSEAVNEMLKYKRRAALRKNTLPLVFNDYMNCLWGKPSDEELIPLIDKASEIGCECFCIDDGWHIELGDWMYDDKKFGQCGFKGIIEYIKSKGMRAGVWFEFESCSKKFAAQKGLSILLRNGVPVSGERPLLDKSDKKVREYLKECVACVYAAGVRYIKNDYNNCTGVGTDMYGTSPSEGTRRNHAAFIDFIESLYKDFPDLIIENCASGAMRFDFATLKHFDLQSTSDQEDYLLNPSIAVGMSALIPSERAGVWVYPYPALFGKEAPEMGSAEFSDGEQTVFNIVNGFAGNMYVSGRIERCDEKNLSLLKNGIAVYKRYREFIYSAFPEYLCPFREFSNREYNALGYTDSKKNNMLLLLWNLETEKFELDLKKYEFKIAYKVYPDDFGEYEFNFKDGILTVDAGGRNRARILRFEKLGFLRYHVMIFDIQTLLMILFSLFKYVNEASTIYLLSD